jgi:glutaconate CoA-transferase subunit B
MKFDSETGEMMVVSLHPGVTIEKVWENTPWKVKVAEKLETTPAPTEEEVSALRALDPQKIYLG